MVCKTYIIFASVVALGIFFILVQLCLIHYCNDEYFMLDNAPNSFQKDTVIPIILWWTPFGNNGLVKTCGSVQCYFTHNRTFQFDSRLKSILFYGSNFHVDDLPYWKSNYVQWGIIHEESPRNNPIFVHEGVLKLFNYSATFSRFSDVPLTLVDLPNIEQLLGKEYFIITKHKTALMQKENLAPVLYIQSDCDTASDRDSYVVELMKYIRIDSYGSCVNNLQLQDRLKNNYLDILKSDEFLSFVARYKFTIAFENAVCYDYITEKLWRPLIVGSVPIYYGSPSFKDWLPNNKSAISVLDFQHPKELAQFLLNLVRNDSEYETYLSHKLTERNNQIINERLLNAFAKRSEIPTEFGDYVEEFECLVCKKIHSNNHDLIPSTVSKEHYDCPLPRNPISGEINENNWWLHQWIIERCGAKLLVHYISNNISIDIEHFNEQKLDLYYQNKC